MAKSTSLDKDFINLKKTLQDVSKLLTKLMKITWHLCTMLCVMVMWRLSNFWLSVEQVKQIWRDIFILSMLQAFPKACEVNKTTRKKKKSIGKVWQTFTPPRPLSLPLFAHPGTDVHSLSCWLACSMSTPLNGLKETSATCTEANFYLVIHVTSVDHSFNITILDFNSVFVLWPISPADLHKWFTAG